MRPKVVIPILLLAIGGLGIAAWLSKSFRPQAAPAFADVPTAKSDAAPAPPKVVLKAVPAPATPRAREDTVAAKILSNAAVEIAPVSQQAHEEFVSKRSDELMGLAMEKSPEAHQQIVDELKNPDKEIRKAALEAIQQADDRSVVPQMRQIADQTDDPAEKQAILEAIDFINLPTLTEYLHQHQKR